MVMQGTSEQGNSTRRPSQAAGPQGLRGGFKRAAPLILMVILAFAAAGVSYMLTAYHRSGGRQAVGVYDLMCGYQGAGCEQVIQSRYGYLGNTNIPISAMGLVYFGSLGLWYLVVGRANRRGRWWHLLPLILNLGGVGWSLRLTWIMVAVLREMCWWCLTAQVFNVIMLVLAFVLWPRAGDSAGRAKPSFRLATAGLLLMASVLVVTLLGLSASQWRQVALTSREQARRYRNDPALMAFAYSRREPNEIPLRPDDPTLGADDAEHTVVIFSDFRCGACTKLAAILEDKVLPAYAGEVRVVFKHYPLDNVCNPKARWSTSFNSCAAAQAAEAARDLQGSAGFWKMHDQLFDRWRELAGEPDWEALADAVGLDGRRVAAAVAGQTYQQRILEDIELGVALGVTGTPIVFLDGKRLTEWHRLEMWHAILRPEKLQAPDEEFESYEVLDI